LIVLDGKKLGVECVYFNIIALDVDGTLLNDQYELTEATRQAVREARQQGAEIVLCTGRGPANAAPVMKQLGLEGVLITHNGALTVRTPGNEVIHLEAFRMDNLRQVVRTCRDQDIHFNVCTVQNMYIESWSDAEKEIYGKHMLSPEIVEDCLQIEEPVVKLTMFGSEEQMDNMEAQLTKTNVPAELHWIRSGTQFIDVMSRSANKGKALQQLAEQWGVPAHRIMAIGNYYNDIEMIEYAGLGIAMDNSPEAVKAAADAVTASNNDDGVSKALHMYVLTEKTPNEKIGQRIRKER
jgi:hypothetical protein